MIKEITYYYVITCNERIVYININSTDAIDQLKILQKQDEKPSMIPRKNYYLQVVIN